MNKKMSRYKGLILSCVSMMMIVVCVCSFSFESKASGLEFYTNYARPYCSDYQGYITVLLQNTDGAYGVETYFWYSAAEVNALSSPCFMVVDMSSSALVFRPGGVVSSATPFMAVSSISTGGIYHFNGFTSTTRMEFSYVGTGWTIVACKFDGNIGSVNGGGISPNIDFSVFYAEDNSSILLQNQLGSLANIYASLNFSNEISLNSQGVLSNILNSNESIENKIEELKELENELIQEQKKSNTWLEKIWNSIQEFLTPDDEDEEESDKLESESNDKTDKLDDLNEQNKTDKTDIDDASNSVDENVDLESIDNYGKVLATITENQYILQILLLVFSVALVAYVLFGKK